MSSTDNANMMKLCRVLVGTGAESDKARAACATQKGRVELFASYGIAATKQGDPGYLLANYEQGQNFNLAIQAMLTTATQVLSNMSSKGPAVREQLLNWEPTALFDFLYRLTQDKDLYLQLHALFPDGPQTAQKEFLQTNLPQDSYGERAAIAAFAGSDQDKDLATSLGKVMTTFESKYQFLC
jgi:hypothetical protein